MSFADFLFPAPRLNSLPSCVMSCRSRVMVMFRLDGRVSWSLRRNSTVGHVENGGGGCVSVTMPQVKATGNFSKIRTCSRSQIKHSSPSHVKEDVCSLDALTWGRSGCGERGRRPPAVRVVRACPVLCWRESLKNEKKEHQGAS